MNITLEWMHSLVEWIKGRFLHLQRRLVCKGVGECVPYHCVPTCVQCIHYMHIYI